MNRTSVHMVGQYVLLEQMDAVSKTPLGIVIPDNKKVIVCGRVVQKGPGFLMPNNNGAYDEVESLIGAETLKARFIPLDVAEGDLVYYHKDGGEEIYLDGRHYVIVPYTAIRLFTRMEKGQ